MQEDPLVFACVCLVSLALWFFTVTGWASFGGHERQQRRGDPSRVPQATTVLEPPSTLTGWGKVVRSVGEACRLTIIPPSSAFLFGGGVQACPPTRLRVGRVVASAYCNMRLFLFFACKRNSGRGSSRRTSILGKEGWCFPAAYTILTGWAGR